MKRIIVYQSKTGFTRRYAQWLQEALLCDLKEYKKVTKKELASYDQIIYGSYIRIEKVRGWSRIKQLTGDNKKKNLILFATGSSPAMEKDHINGIFEASIPSKELLEIPHFYMQSGLNYERMSLGERVLMKGFAAMMKWKRKDRDLSKSFNVSSKEYIKPLVDYVNRMQQN